MAVYRHRHPHPATNALLEYLGYDPAEIAVDGFTATSFQKIILNEDGTRLILDGSMVTETEYWSGKGVDGGMIMAVYNAERIERGEDI